MRNASHDDGRRVGRRREVESEATEEAGPFARPGERSYGYRIQLPGGEELGVGVNSAVGDYEEERRILDLMMPTLQVLEG